MSDEPEVRIGTAEREAAQQQLNDHFSQGRLDVAEFEQRSTQVAGARTHADLDAVFHDLPRPPAPAGAAPAAVSAKQPSRNWRYTVIGATPFIALILFFALGGIGVSQAWLVFLLIPLSGVLLGGDDYRDRRRRRRRYDD